MSGEVTRQHDTTTVHEVAGLVCEEWLAVHDPRAGRHGVHHIRLGGVHHRFFQDAGLLFWKSAPAPDPGEDLLDGEILEDLAARLNATGAILTRVTMHDGRLLLEFANGARAVWHNPVDGCGSTLIDCTPGTARPS